MPPDGETELCTADRCDIDYAAEIARLQTENALLERRLIRRKPKVVRTFQQRSKHDTTTKGSPQGTYSKSGRWTERGGTHADFVSPYPKDQAAYWKRYWRELGLE